MNSIRRKWKTLQPAIETHGRKAIETLYSEIDRDMIKKMAEDAALSKLGSIDEELYSHCAWLMGVYEEIVTFYENFREDITNPEIHGITDGIITILFSRIREFEESAPADGINPIAAEKEAIISQAGAQLEKTANIEWQVFFPEPWGSLAMAKWVQDGMTKEALLSLSEATHSRVFPYLYGAYREALALCCDQLNDFQRRTAVQFYKTMMEDEFEILSTIIKIQVQALEQAAKNNLPDSAANIPGGPGNLSENYPEDEYFLEQDLREATSFEENKELPETESFQQSNSLKQEDPGEIVVHKILSLLREAYQRFGKSYKEIFAALQQSEEIPSTEQPKPESCNYKCFEAFLNTCLKQAKYINDTALEDKVHTFKSHVEQAAESILGQYRLAFFKSLHRFRRIVAGEMLLANEMTDAFTKLRDNWPEIKPEGENAEIKGTEKVTETEGAEILRGVAETIEIKIEGLRESIGQIKEECAGIIESFVTDNPAPSDEDIEAAKAAVWQLWAQDPDNFAPNKNYSNSPVLTERRKHREKSISRCQEALEKKLQKFKCESLLYEISTYEEIIFYSVSRLRKLESPVFQQSAVLADDTLSLLETLLKKNNIEVIRPQPHDPFNSKEHEVLMAESAPDFKKGEIVKLMTSGYRQNDVMLLRANVIAAR